MKQLILKCLRAAAACAAVNWWFCGRAVVDNAKPLISWSFEVCLVFALMQAVIIAVGCVHPLEAKQHKIIYWYFAELLFALTAGIWGFVFISTALA